MIAIVTHPAVHRCSCYCADRERERSKVLEAALREIADPKVPNSLGLPESRLYLAKQIALAALERSK